MFCTFIQTINDSGLLWKPAWRTDIKTLYDVISYNDITSALSSYVFGRNVRFTHL